MFANSVIGVSIARFTFIINLNLVSPDITWNFVNVQIWTGVESHVGIICGKPPSPSISTPLIPPCTRKPLIHHSLPPLPPSSAQPCSLWLRRSQSTSELYEPQSLRRPQRTLLQPLGLTSQKLQQRAK